MTDFVSEYLCVPAPPDPMHALAVEYHDRCDAFDKALCPPDGLVLNFNDACAVNKHAHKVRREIEDRHGMDPDAKRMLHEAINREAGNRGK